MTGASKRMEYTAQSVAEKIGEAMNKYYKEISDLIPRMVNVLPNDPLVADIQAYVLNRFENLKPCKQEHILQARAYVCTFVRSAVKDYFRSVSRLQQRTVYVDDPNSSQDMLSIEDPNFAQIETAMLVSSLLKSNQECEFVRLKLEGWQNNEVMERLGIGRRAYNTLERNVRQRVGVMF